MTYYYYVRRERVRDWRVYLSWVGSGDRGDCVAEHATRNGAVADCRRRNAAKGRDER